MKKIVLSIVAMFMAVASMAQAPSVTITYDSIATDQITVAYAKNADCTNYYIFSGNIGEAEGWVPMMGSLENVIKSWGIGCTNDTTKVWDQLTPNTPRVHYVLAMAGETQVLITDTVSTLALGGEGLSTMTIAISEVTDSSAHVVVTPNDQTSEFHTILVTKALYDEWGQDSLVNYMKDDPYPQYDVDDHVWPGLISGTAYKVVAFGVNINNEMGTVAVDSFTTTGVRPTPSVEIKIDTVEPLQIKASYVKNVVCDSFYIFSGYVGELDQWLPMMGSIEAVVKSWGIKCMNDTTKVWDALTPNTDYVFYALAAGSDGEFLVTDTIKSGILGGEGLSTIEIAVSEITDSTARVICTANDQTSEFHTILLTSAMFAEWGQDSVINYVKQDPYAQYVEDDHVWFDLLAGTEYKAIALGKNANGEWGELKVADFATTGTNGIDDIETINVTVYPNPTTDKVKVAALNEGAIVTLYDIQGRIMMTQKSNGSEMILDMTNLSEGIYILQANMGKGTVARGVRVIKK